MLATGNHIRMPRHYRGHDINWLMERSGLSSTTLEEVDWVAVADKQPARTGKLCDGYKKIGDRSKDGTERAYQLQIIDEKVTVYDVKTSTAVDTKEFKAKNTCPSMVFSGAASSYVSSDDEKAWLRELRTKRK